MNEWSGGCIDHASCLEQTVLRRSLSIASEPTKKNFEKNRSPWHYYDCCCGNKHGIDIECPIRMWFKLISIQFTAWYSIFFGNGRCSVDHTIYVGWSAWLADCRIVNPDLRSSLRIIFFLLLDCFRLERKSAFYPKKLLFMKLSGLIILWIINIWCRSKYSCSSDCSEQANFSGKSQRMNTYRSTNDPSLCAVGYKQWLFTWNLITTYLYIYREWYENISCECTEPPRGAYERNYKCGVWFWDSAFWADRCARFHLNDATQNTSRIEWAKCRIIITYIACVFVVIPHSALAYAMHDS